MMKIAIIAAKFSWKYAGNSFDCGRYQAQQVDGNGADGVWF